MLRAPLARAFRFAVLQASGSLSIARTRLAPKERLAIARIPLPVPASSIVQPGWNLRVIRSSKRRHIAVVAWSPVPKAVSAGMIIERHALFRCDRLPRSGGDLRITRREPIRNGLP